MPRKDKKRRPRREYSAGFVLLRRDGDGVRFLLLDYGKHWDYPKGHLEPGESAWQAAVRELREETGIRQVDRVGSFQQDIHYGFHSPRKGPISKTVTYFLGVTTEAEVRLSDEHEGFAWLLFDEALERLTYENARALLRAAAEALASDSAGLISAPGCSSRTTDGRSASPVAPPADDPGKSG